VALPTLVTGPVRLALVVTLLAVKAVAVPVIFVPTNADGVPNAGVTRVGDVANTTDPDPVVVAALIAVPLPCKIPVMEVVRVMAGVVVDVATVPANPLALTTETLVTVPEAPLPLEAAVIWPAAFTVRFTFVYEPGVTAVAESELLAIFVITFAEPDILLLVRVCVAVSVITGSLRVPLKKYN